MEYGLEIWIRECKEFVWSGLPNDSFEVTVEWRKLHNEELQDVHCSPSIVRIIKARRMRWAGHVALIREKRDAYSFLVGKPEGRRPPGRPRCRWLDIIKIDLVQGKYVSRFHFLISSHVIWQRFYLE
jgi:hypothetical protein